MDWTLTIALGSVIVAVCALLDWTLSREEEEKARLKLVAWFANLDDFDYGGALRSSHRFFNRFFDRVFGRRTWSLRFFVTSAVASYFAIALVTAVFVLAGRFDEGGGRWIENDRFAALIGISLFVNVWVDIASLAETRWVLRFADARKVRTVLALLGMDLVFSALIYLLPLYMLISLSEGGAMPVGEIGRDLLTWSGSTEAQLQVCFWSTFFTSAIFYAFVAAVLLTKGVKLARTRVMVVLEKLESSNHLFKSVGAMLAAVLALIKGTQDLLRAVGG